MASLSHAQGEIPHARDGLATLECSVRPATPSLGVYAAIKVAGEWIFALVLLALASPLLLLAMLLVKLTSRGPVLYSQPRVGRRGRPFTIYKIRTMRHRCEDASGACWSPPGDTRVTRVGRWLRRCHIDELPQLWNVVRGDMSLVGPRPERPEFVPQLEKAIPFYELRLGVRPGLTGLAQVQQPPDTDLESVRVKLAYDLHYVGHIGPWLDLRILLATGLHLAGMPFRSIRVLLGLPRKYSVEQAYHRLTLPARMQPQCGTNGHQHLNGAARAHS